MGYHHLFRRRRRKPLPLADGRSCARCEREFIPEYQSTLYCPACRRIRAQQSWRHHARPIPFAEHPNAVAPGWPPK